MGKPGISNRARKRWLLAGVVIVAAAAGLGLAGQWIAKGGTAAIETVYIQQAAFKDGKLHVAGGFASSGADYRGYDIHQENGELSIEIRSSVIALGKRSGGFTIDYLPDDAADQEAAIHKVYLSDGENRRLIWPPGY